MKIFMIDDNEEQCEDLKIQFSKDGSIFHFETNLEDALKSLKHDIDKYDLIILDASGKVSKEREESLNHVHEAFSDIRVLSKQVQIIIYTGHAHEFPEKTEKMFKEKVEVLSKGDFAPGSEKLYNRISSIIRNAPVNKLKRKFPILFQLFDDGLLSKSSNRKNKKEDDIYNSFCRILDIVEHDEFDSLGINEKRGIYAGIRFLIEHIHARIEEFFPNISLEGKFNDNNYFLSGSKMTIEGKYENTTTVYQDSAIDNAAKVAYHNPGSYIHFDRDEKGFYTKYGFYAAAYALFEVMLWYKNGIDTDLFLTNPDGTKNEE